MEPTYQFQAKWKEELICKTAVGEFILEFPMGNPTVYMPTKGRWISVAPRWAENHWEAFREQISNWCSKNNVVLVIDETANVYT